MPYGAWQASERLKLWGALGYGRGEMTLKPKEQGEIKADLNWTMAAVGARAALLDPDGEGLSLDLLSDALWTRTTSEKVAGLAGTEAEVTRLRLGLEGSWANLLQGGSELTPKFSLGARLDGGDAETGFGMELGGGVVWSSPGAGLSLDLDARTLLFHEADGLKDWGFSAGLVFDPQPESERGLSVTLGQDWGGGCHRWYRCPVCRQSAGAAQRGGRNQPLDVGGGLRVARLCRSLHRRPLRGSGAGGGCKGLHGGLAADAGGHGAGHHLRGEGHPLGEQRRTTGSRGGTGHPPHLVIR